MTLRVTCGLRERGSGGGTLPDLGDGAVADAVIDSETGLQEVDSETGEATHDATDF